MSDEKSEKRLKCERAAFDITVIDTKIGRKRRFSIDRTTGGLPTGPGIIVGFLILLIDHINELHEGIDKLHKNINFLDGEIQGLKITHAEDYALLYERIARLEKQTQQDSRHQHHG